MLFAPMSVKFEQQARLGRAPSGTPQSPSRSPQRRVPRLRASQIECQLPQPCSPDACSQFLGSFVCYRADRDPDGGPPGTMVSSSRNAAVADFRLRRPNRELPQLSSLKSHADLLHADVRNLVATIQSQKQRLQFPRESVSYLARRIIGNLIETIERPKDHLHQLLSLKTG